MNFLSFKKIALTALFLIPLTVKMSLSTANAAVTRPSNSPCDDLSSLRHQLQVAQEALENILHTQAGLRERLANNNQQTAQLYGQLAALEVERSYATDEQTIEELNQAIENCRSAISDLSRDHNEIWDALLDIGDKIERKNQEITDLQNRIDNLEEACGPTEQYSLNPGMTTY